MRGFRTRGPQDATHRRIQQALKVSALAMRQRWTWGRGRKGLSQWVRDDDALIIAQDVTGYRVYPKIPHPPGYTYGTPLPGTFRTPAEAMYAYTETCGACLGDGEAYMRRDGTIQPCDTCKGSGQRC